MSQSSMSPSDSPSKTSLTKKHYTFHEMWLIKKFAYKICDDRIAVPDHQGMGFCGYRPMLWHLTDYCVESVSGGSIWLAPRPPVMDEYSLKFPGEKT